MEMIPEINDMAMMTAAIEICYEETHTAAETHAEALLDDISINCLDAVYEEYPRISLDGIKEIHDREYKRAVAAEVKGMIMRAAIFEGKDKEKIYDKVYDRMSENKEKYKEEPV